MKTTTPKTGSNMETVLKLIQKRKGATLATIAEATGWDVKMVARNISNLRNKGIKVTRDDAGRYFSAKLTVAPKAEATEKVAEKKAA